jgi:hypothetical protein
MSAAPANALRNPHVGAAQIDVGHISALPATPAWALRHDDLPVPTPTAPAQ